MVVNASVNVNRKMINSSNPDTQMAAVKQALSKLRGIMEDSGLTAQYIGAQSRYPRPQDIKNSRVYKKKNRAFKAKKQISEKGW